jgi:hypothetical protein
LLGSEDWVADKDEKSDGGSGWRIKPWERRLVAGLLIIAGAVHAFKPAWLALDWPTIAVILVGVVLLFVPLEDWGIVLESFEIGKAKFLLRKVKQLDESVERAVSEEVAGANQPKITPSPGLPDDEVERQVETEGQRSPWGDFFVDPRNRRLFDTDKEMMLIRIGIDIERILVQLDRGVAASSRPIVWSRTVENLAARGIITPQIAKALIEFRDVRNRLIHPSGGSVTNAFIASAVDSGIKLLRLLTGIREMNEGLPPD